MKQVCHVANPSRRFPQSRVIDRGGDTRPLNLVADEIRKVVGGYDPQRSIRTLEIPGLWLYGAQDRHVPTATSSEFLESLRRDVGKQFTVKIYPNGDHGLRDTDTGNGIDYWPDVFNWMEFVAGI